MALSCDIYYYKLGEMLGMDQLEHYGERVFGLEPDGNLDLRASRQVPSKQWYRSMAESVAAGFTLSVSVGQGAGRTTFVP